MKRVIYKQFISPSNPLESTATTAAKSYVKPPLSVNPAYDHAVKLLQRKTASPALSPIALAYTDFENHFKFNVSKVNPTESPVFEAMEKRRWETALVPRLLKHAEAMRIIGDAFPTQITPEIQVNLKWPQVTPSWLAAYGHPVPPNWTIYSPEVSLVVTGNVGKEKLYTLMLTDLDRPNVQNGTIEEFCHWKIVNIPAKDRLVIPFGSSPFLKNPLEMPAIDSIDPCLAKTPNPPLEPPTLPGDTIFGYLPPHPAHSNPKKNRRYLLTVMEQSSKINADELKLAIKAKVAEAAAEAEKSVSSSSAPEGFSIVAQGLVQRENELEFKERSVALPTWKFVKDNQLKVVGYGFFKSTWNLLTPPIYNALGIHEPVYGKVQQSNSKMFVSKTGKVMKMINNALTSSATSSTSASTDSNSIKSTAGISPVLAQIADSNAIPSPLVVTRSNYSQAPVATRLVDLVNLGKERAAPSVRRPSPEAEAVIRKKLANLAQEAERIKAKRAADGAAGGKQKKKGSSTPVAAAVSTSAAISWRSSMKMPKMTSVAAVGLAKTREVDGSGKFMGPLTKTHTPSRSRYHNVSTAKQMIRPPLPPPPAKPSYGSRTLLYMDVMNYATSKFFPVKAPHAKLGQAFARVKRFVSAARRANIELTIFIVAVQDTAEAHKKWMSRREREMLKGIQNTPQGIRTLLVDAFEACQVPVVCSLTHDADDCIAGYANKYGASILSQDNDYFRYRNASESYKVYKDTQVVDGKMILIEHTGDAKNNKTRGIKERDFLDPLPPLSPGRSVMTSFISNGMYRRGTGTPLAKDLGNPHITIRPLRQALYARKLSPESCTVKFIHETFCEWDEEEEVVRWVEEDVFPDATLDHLLDQPEAAFRHFFGRTLSITDESAFDAKDWDKHVFALYSVVFEICSLAGGPSLLELLLKQFESTEQIEKTMSKISLQSECFQYTCVSCGRPSQLSPKELEFYKSKNFAMPKKCKVCKKGKSLGN